MLKKIKNYLGISLADFAIKLADFMIKHHEHLSKKDARELLYMRGEIMQKKRKFKERNYAK